MRRFLYLRDPLFVLGCSAYVLNRWLIKPRLHGRFLHSHFNDLWLIPCALPLVLWLHRQLGLRAHDEPPQRSEIIGHLVLWSLWFEWIGPKVMTHATGDPADVLAYVVGATLAGTWWNREWLLARLS